MTCPGCGSWTPHAPGRLNAAIEQADTWPDSAANLPDHMLSALLAWSDGSSKALQAEAALRRDQYLAIADRYNELADQFPDLGSAR